MINNFTWPSTCIFTCVIRFPALAPTHCTSSVRLHLAPRRVNASRRRGAPHIQENLCYAYLYIRMCPSFSRACPDTLHIICTLAPCELTRRRAASTRRASTKQKQHTERQHDISDFGPPTPKTKSTNVSARRVRSRPKQKTKFTHVHICFKLMSIYAK